MQAQFVNGNPLMVDHTPSSAVAVGDIVVLTDAIRIAHSAIAANELGALAAGGGVYDVLKAGGAGEVFTEGDTVFWDDTNNVAVTTVGTSNVVIGLAVAAAADADTSVRVHHRPN